jgi:hypothetical protein
MLVQMLVEMLVKPGHAFLGELTSDHATHTAICCVIAAVTHLSRECLKLRRERAAYFEQARERCAREAVERESTSSTEQARQLERLPYVLAICDLHPLLVCEGAGSLVQM